MDRRLSYKTTYNIMSEYESLSLTLTFRERAILRGIAGLPPG